MTPIEWLLGDDRGVSSETIVMVMTNSLSASRFEPDIPHDIYDMGRCVRLLQHFPAYRVRLSEMTARFPMWAPVVQHWQLLENTYRVLAEDRHGCRAFDAVYKPIREEALAIHALPQTAPRARATPALSA